MENKKIYGYIYLITNLINGKQYVGQTVQTVEERFANHCNNKRQVISKAIRKHKRENFTVEQVDVAYNQIELDLLEGVYMAWFKTLAPNGYNIKEIINGKGRHNKETIEKMKTAHNKMERLKQNSENGKKHRGKIVNGVSSKYIGVYIKRNKFISNIGFNFKTYYLGNYNIESDAAKAYDIAAIKYFGNDATLNFPELRQGYIDSKIIIKRNKKELKSGIKGIWFNSKYNKWRVRYFDKSLNKKRNKHFKTLEEAFKFKNIIS